MDRTRRQLIYMMLAAAAIATAADAPDPGGWTAAKWGMTIDQVRSAIADSAPLNGPERDRKIDGQVSPLGIPTIKLGRAGFAAYFLFDAEGKLDGVAFQSAPDSISAANYTDLSLLLARQYGNPIDRQSGRSRTSQWSLGTTTIDLRYTDLAPTIQFHSLWLTYRKFAPSRL